MKRLLSEPFGTPVRPSVGPHREISEYERKAAKPRRRQGREHEREEYDKYLEEDVLPRLHREQLDDDD